MYPSRGGNARNNLKFPFSSIKSQNGKWNSSTTKLGTNQRRHTSRGYAPVPASACGQAHGSRTHHTQYAADAVEHTEKTEERQSWQLGVLWCYSLSLLQFCSRARAFAPVRSRALRPPPPAPPPPCPRKPVRLRSLEEVAPHFFSFMFLRVFRPLETACILAAAAACSSASLRANLLRCTACRRTWLGLGLGLG